MTRRKHITPEQKMLILREFLENQTPISKLAEKYEIHPNDIYNWKKKLFESAEEVFSNKGKNNDNFKNDKQKQLERKLIQKDTVIAELVNENISLKKNLNGGI